MKTRSTIMFLACLSISTNAFSQDKMHYEKSLYTTKQDAELAQIMSLRAKDWRNGAVVYQVIVDRFAPSSQLANKVQYYAHPRTLKKWSEKPSIGQAVAGTDNWSQELEFWGGDLQSLSGKLDYLEELGVDVLYLNPIQHALTNHKYDAIDYKAISPEYGTRSDVKNLADMLHTKNMKLVLDGVFNHMGTSSTFFKQAQNNPDSPYRNWFFFNDDYKRGFRSWIDSKSLPELRLENDEVRDYLYRDSDSVIQGYLADGVDGWRLDVAFDVGPVYLEELTKFVHQAKSDSLVIGEIWNYPDHWFPSLDGVMNFPIRKLIQSVLEEKITAATAEKMIASMVEDTGIENMLKSWTLLDNHDTQRLKNMLPLAWQQNIAQTLQFTLPGSPNLYYGAELGMEGGDDPENRAPMRWELNNDKNTDLIRTKKLIDMHHKHRALKIGNYRSVISTNLLAFERYTENVLETVIVLVNSSNETVNETVMLKNWKIMNGTAMVDIFSGEKVSEVRSSLLEVSLKAHSALILKPVDFNMDWSPYERIR